MMSIKTAIYKKFIGESIIDLILRIPLLLERLVQCKILEDFDYNLDYQPILSKKIL